MKLDKNTVFGITIGLLGIGIGSALEGGTPTQILQPAAALIVLGGTLGAVMIQFPVRVLTQALVQLKDLFLKSRPAPDSLVQHLLRYAYKARKEGILSLDTELAKIQDPFLRESLMLAIDGVKPAELRKMMELQLEYEGEKSDRIPRVFDAAGGFSPTFGIIGAVLGLIQVMQRLQNMDEVGKGIAAAFVATIYGVGAANLFFLPIAGKLRILIREKQVVQEMTLEAVLAIVEGVHPRALEQRLNSFGTEPARPYLKVIGQ